MSNVEVEGAVEVEDPFAPSANLDDLFEDDPEPPAAELNVDGLSEEELRKQVVALQKKAEFEREERLKASRKGWIEEAKKHFPYSNPEKISADSRRAFLKEAKSQDDDFRERAKDVLEQTSKTREEVEAEVRAKLEAEYEQAWGRPSIASGGVPMEEAEVNKRVEDARRRRDLKGVAKALMDGRVI